MFHLQEYIKQQARGVSRSREFDITRTTAEDFLNWQRRFRDALRDGLGIADLPEQVTSERLSVTDYGSYIEEKHRLTADDLPPIPMYLLLPKSPPPHRAILAFHGHGMGVGQILGHYAALDETTRQATLAADENFAQRFAQDGYFVCAIEQQGFGERVTDQVNDSRNSCRHLAFEYLMQGKTLVGERVREGMAALSYLVNRDDIDRDCIGCTGHSGGATTALFLSALDERIQAAVISGYFCDYEQSILGMPHCECNYVPRLNTLSTIGDLGALIAPRPLCIIHGAEDPIFPLSGVKTAYAAAQHGYELVRRKNAISLLIHKEGHRYDYAAALQWGNRWLCT